MEHPTTPGTPHIHIVRPAPRGLSVSAGHMRLGVLGGAYNPITLAHLAAADTTRRTFDLHEILLLLPEVPPHKTIFGASLEQRLAMMQLAVRDLDYVAVGLSTHGLFIDIYHGLQEVYAQHSEVFFVTGRDAAERILTWEYTDTTATLQQMFTAFQLIVCDRDGAFRIPDDPRLSAYHHRLHRCALPTRYNHISSSVVRQRCQQRLSLDDLVPAAVASYIQEHGLYAEATSDT